MNHFFHSLNLTPNACRDMDMSAGLDKLDISSSSEIPSSDKGLKCRICLKKFYKRPEFEKHINSHSGRRNYVCTICNKGFSFKAKWQAHLNSHSDGKIHSCDRCSKEFNSRESLRMHQITHHYLINKSLINSAEIKHIKTKYYLTAGKKQFYKIKLKNGCLIKTLKRPIGRPKKDVTLDEIFEKRKVGRPRKIVDNSGLVLKRKMGRPRKNPVCDEIKEKRKPGRPKKNSLPENNVKPKSLPITEYTRKDGKVCKVTKKMGRPRKEDLLMRMMEKVKRKQGRPKKNLVNEETRTIAQNLNKVERKFNKEKIRNKQVKDGQEKIKRKPGRPKKNAVPETSLEKQEVPSMKKMSIMGDKQQGVVKKKRGRPKKIKPIDIAIIEESNTLNEEAIKERLTFSDKPQESGADNPAVAYEEAKELFNLRLKSVEEHEEMKTEHKTIENEAAKQDQLKTDSSTTITVVQEERLEVESATAVEDGTKVKLETTAEVAAKETVEIADEVKTEEKMETAFEPTTEITNTTINNLTQLAAAKEKMDLDQQLPQNKNSQDNSTKEIMDMEKMLSNELSIEETSTLLKAILNDSNFQMSKDAKKEGKLKKNVFLDDLIQTLES